MMEQTFFDIDYHRKCREVVSLIKSEDIGKLEDELLDNDWDYETQQLFAYKAMKTGNVELFRCVIDNIDNHETKSCYDSGVISLYGCTNSSLKLVKYIVETLKVKPKEHMDEIIDTLSDSYLADSNFPDNEKIDIIQYLFSEMRDTDVSSDRHPGTKF